MNDEPLPRSDQMSEMHWTRPKLVAQIRFVEWTAEGRLRHAAFIGLRTDKAAQDVRRETGIGRAQ